MRLINENGQIPDDLKIKPKIEQEEIW